MKSLKGLFGATRLKIKTVRTAKGSGDIVENDTEHLLICRLSDHKAHQWSSNHMFTKKIIRLVISGGGEDNGW